MAIVEAQGQSGGIWALAYTGCRVRFGVLEVHDQCISVKISFGNSSWVCTGVYASPHAARRMRLWDYLGDLRRTISRPWALIGDFNDILLPSEQAGGHFPTSNADAFAQGVDRCGLMDMDFFGSKFTWQGRCRGNRLVSRRLDRGLCDHSWRMRFPEATVEHLVKRHSDHVPLLLRCSNTGRSRQERPFRFQAAWCTHDAYRPLVQKAWDRERGNIVQALLKVQTESLTFNKEVFGNVFAKKRELEGRLRGIQRVLEEVDSASLLQLQATLLHEYEAILFREETIWFQKSREKWIKLGSRNTSFFHTQTVVRRKRNKIHGLHLPSGEWCTDDETLKLEAVRFYQQLFCATDHCDVLQVSSHLCRLTTEDREALTGPVTTGEVYRALMSMKSYKAPGPDGFQPIFFKMFWEDVGDEVWHFVRDAFAQGYFNEQLAETLMVLIPKSDHPTSFKEFRPISLCNAVYKILTKVLVTRLRPMLARIISPLQSSFIPGRSTKDNAIILKEVVHHMKKSSRKKGDMVFKLDLEKAYDRVDYWGFLSDTLRVFGFPSVIISLIMHGITSSSISLLWNGSRTPNFAPRRGLRQGDPISPYLFVLCIERLGAMITDEVYQGSWHPIRVSKNGPSISHLFFADDVLLFAKAKPSQARLVSNVLDKFCVASGLRVSFEKSRVFALGGVTRTRKNKITGITSVQFTDRLEKYLGFHIHHGRPKKEDYAHLTDKVASKLAAWKGRLLNKPGRVTLANAVLTAMPTYEMQVGWFPTHVCDQLDRTIRQFIWKGSTGKGLHMVSWDRISQPKKEGGLGIRRAREQNVALLGKLASEVLHSPDKLWVRVLSDKYLNGQHLLDGCEPRGSHMWRSLVKALNELKGGFEMKLGNGSCSVWYTPWVTHHSLCHTIPFVDIQDTKLQVRDMWGENGWNLGRMRTLLPEEVVQS